MRTSMNNMCNTQKIRTCRHIHTCTMYLCITIHHYCGKEIFGQVQVLSEVGAGKKWNGALCNSLVLHTCIYYSYYTETSTHRCMDDSTQECPIYRYAGVHVCGTIMQTKQLKVMMKYNRQTTKNVVLQHNLFP